MRQHNLNNSTTIWNSGSILPNAYKEDITYDANGNIKRYRRNNHFLLSLKFEKTELPISRTLKTNNILFSQQKVNDLHEIVASIRSKGWAGPPIDVVELDNGKFGTLDNTRVLAASEAGINVKAAIHKQTDLLTTEQAQRFSTKKGGGPRTWGDAFKNRIGNQSAGYKKANPNGSYSINGN